MDRHGFEYSGEILLCYPRSTQKKLAARRRALWR